MKKRELLHVVLLSIFTCGIYSIYWLYTTTNELNQTEPEQPLPNYIVALLLSLVTCGIYGIYWFYKFFKKVDSVTRQENFIVNFVLSLVGLSIVSVCLVQNAINQIAE